MQHAEAVRTGAAERYLLGELTDQQALEYEEHFFECRVCAEEMRTAAALADNVREAFSTEVPEPLAVRQPPPPRRPRLAMFWPLPAGAVAAVLLAAGGASYQALVVVPRLRHQVAQSNALQAAPWFFLSVSRSEPQILTLTPGQRYVGLTLSRSSERSAPYYRCQVVAATGRVVQSVTVAGPQAGNELQLLLPASSLPSGTYAIELRGLQTPDGAIVDPGFVRYQFELRRQGGEK
jgi:hypothetical protein